MTREQNVLGVELQPGDVVFVVRQSGPGEDLAVDPRPPEWYTLLREVELGSSSRRRRFEVDGGYVEVNRQDYYQRQ